MGYNKELKRIEVTKKTIPTIKSEIRLELTNMLEEFFKEKFEVNEGDVLRIDKKTVCSVVSEITDEDGFVYEVCTTVNPVIKSWKDTNEDAKRFVPAFDRFNEAAGIEE